MIRIHGIVLIALGVVTLCFYRENLEAGLASFAAPSVDGDTTLSDRDSALLRSISYMFPISFIAVGVLNTWRAITRSKKP